jgi:hypothetical protein
MASTAMRLAILAAFADTLYVPIDGRHFERPLPRSFFETQGCARNAPAPGSALCGMLYACKIGK